MANEFYGYFDSVAGDEREYDAAGFAHVLRAATQNGVSSHNGGGLEVSAVGNSMQTAVGAGGCLINGYLYVLSDDGGAMKTFEHVAAAGSDRVDRIVARLELMSDQRRITLKLLTGVPGAAPAPPALTRNESVYELSLAQVRVRAGAESVEAADVTDERGDETVCGYAVPARLSDSTLDARYKLIPITQAQVDGILAE